VTALSAEQNVVVGPRALRDSASITLAEAYLKQEGFCRSGRMVLRFWRGDFYRWSESRAAYRRVEREVFRSEMLQFLKTVRVMAKKGPSRAFQPEPRHIKSVLDILEGECQAMIEAMPDWLDEHRPTAADVIAFKNGLLNFHSFSATGAADLMPPTPMWFSELAMPYDLSPGAYCPRWHSFLEQVLKREGAPDAQTIRLLQEWFGYCLTADTRHQKVLMMVGPPRCGKGTIIRALQRVVGEGNCASPNFLSLGERFGLEPLVGKRVATIPDAHLGRTGDAVSILDKILQISGEDRVTVDRKNKSALANTKLGVRFTIAANEPPDLPDSSGAIIHRLLMIQMQETFAGREDLRLDEALAAETPGIALWALDGLKRLRRDGRFTEPDGAAGLRNDYMRQTAPIHAFLEDRCDVGSTEHHWVEVEAFWAKWKEWASANGHHPGSKEGFGKRLRSARPSVYRVRRLRDTRQQYEYVGIRLLSDQEQLFGPDSAPY
jgi:putative DNA primase/helicase